MQTTPMILEGLERYKQALVPQTGRNFWLIRTKDGEYYEHFRSRQVIGLDRTDFELPEITDLKDAYSLRNGDLRLDSLQEEMIKRNKAKNAKKLNKIGRQKGID